jgi:hypothetical protein
MNILKNTLRLLLGLSLSTLLGCASCGLKGQCEAENWYQYGFDLATHGKRIEQDKYVNDCRKEEADIAESKLDVGFKAGMAQYCTAEAIYLVGKNGDGFNEDLCDARSIPTLKAKHREGLISFCQPLAAFQFGLSGKIYGKNCPDNLDDKFIANYNQGRRKYLLAEQEASNQRLRETQRNIRDSESTLLNLNASLLMTPAPPSPAVLPNGELVQDPWSGQRSNLNGQIQYRNNLLVQMRSEENQIKSRLDYLRLELVKVSDLNL